MSPEEARSFGKSLLLSAALAIGCSGPTVYARQDYEQYPAHKKEIALDNLRQIAGNFCVQSGPRSTRYPHCYEMTLDERKIDYVEQNCARWGYYAIQGQTVESCQQKTNRSESIYWYTIRKIVPGWQIEGGYNVKICGEGRTCSTITGFRDQRQAADFAEAMAVYLKE